MPVAAPDRETVLAALDSVLGWPEIARSPQLGRFLDYIVRRTLDGDEQAIKAYSIAVDVFGRTTDFDPQADPIVRVQARRLRGLLDQYYATAGSGDAVRIALPVGRYVPEFNDMRGGETPDAVAPPSVEPAGTPHPPRRGIMLSWLTLLVITLGVAALAYALSDWEARQHSGPAALADLGPSVTIVEFQDLSGGGDKPVVAGLALELVTDLKAFEDIDVRYGGGEAMAALAETAPSDFVLTGIVRRANQAIQYSAILTETASGTVVWSRTIALDQQRAMQAEALDEISRALSLVLGSPRGPLHLPARKMLSADANIAGSQTLYLCHMLFALYREAATSASGERARACFSALSEADRQTPSALAASGSLLAEGVMAPDAPALSEQERMERAGAKLKRAAELAPLSGFVWEQQGRWFELQGQPEAASAAYASSIQLNPANADALAAYARLLALQGHLDEAKAMALRAVAGSPMPPAWYFAVPTLLALHDTHLSMAISHAEIYATADPELGAVLAVTAASEAGNAAVVNRYLPQVLEVVAFRASGILPRLRKRIGDALLLNQIGVALTTAGVPKAALTNPF
ncbi:MAG TPA: tetratricopeptide repeat protein [Devosia sp.]|nr:tetratricopeptide repeat protein [Devosia sp.]